MLLPQTSRPMLSGVVGAAAGALTISLEVLKIIPSLEAHSTLKCPSPSEVGRAGIARARRRGLLGKFGGRGGVRLCGAARRRAACGAHGAAQDPAQHPEVQVNPISRAHAWWGGRRERTYQPLATGPRIKELFGVCVTRHNRVHMRLASIDRTECATAPHGTQHRRAFVPQSSLIGQAIMPPGMPSLPTNGKPVRRRTCWIFW